MRDGARQGPDSKNCWRAENDRFFMVRWLRNVKQFCCDYYVLMYLVVVNIHAYIDGKCFPEQQICTLKGVLCPELHPCQRNSLRRVLYGCCQTMNSKITRNECRHASPRVTSSCCSYALLPLPVLLRSRAATHHRTRLPWHSV